MNHQTRIDGVLKSAAKIHAALNGLTIKQIVDESVRGYLEDNAQDYTSLMLQATNGNGQEATKNQSV